MFCTNADTLLSTFESTSTTDMPSVSVELQVLDVHIQPNNFCFKGSYQMLHIYLQVDKLKLTIRVLSKNTTKYLPLGACSRAQPALPAAGQ